MMFKFVSKYYFKPLSFAVQKLEMLPELTNIQVFKACIYVIIK